MADRSTTLCTCVLPESSIEDIQGFGEERSPLRLGLPNDPRLPHRSPANHNDRHAAPIYGPTGSDNSVGRYSYGLYSYGPTGSDNALGQVAASFIARPQHLFVADPHYVVSDRWLLDTDLRRHPIEPLGAIG